jgi:chondroitin AC lyase
MLRQLLTMALRVSSLVAVSSMVPSHTTSTDDVAVVAERLLDRLLSEAAPAAEARKDAATLREDGSWPDVRYNDTTSTGSWSPHVHLERMQTMAAAVRTTNDSKLVLATNHAIEFWLRSDPRSLNWYWNELAVPAQIANTALLFEPWISSRHTLAIMVKFMERAVYGKRTGANLDAEVSTAIIRAALQSNHTLMRVAFSRLWEEIRVVQPTDPACIAPPRGSQGCPTDGIQIDRSFHQHGPELLIGSYGEAYAVDTLQTLALSANTAFTPSDEQCELFASLLVDGMRWMTVGSPARWDWSVKGRDMGTVARQVKLNASLFWVFDGCATDEQKQQLAAFAASIERQGGQHEQLRGHRAYWASVRRFFCTTARTAGRVVWPIGSPSAWVSLLL